MDGLELQYRSVRMRTKKRRFISGRAWPALRNYEPLRIQELLEGANIFTRVPELAILSERDCANARVRESGQQQCGRQNENKNIRIYKCPARHHIIITA